MIELPSIFAGALVLLVVALFAVLMVGVGAANAVITTMAHACFAGVLGYATGLTALGIVATAFALAAAFLNAAFAFCLGCETYLLIRRFTPTKERALQ